MFWVYYQFSLYILVAINLVSIIFNLHSIYVSELTCRDQINLKLKITLTKLATIKI